MQIFIFILTAYCAFGSNGANHCVECTCKQWDSDTEMYSDCYRQDRDSCSRGYCVRCEQDGTTPMPGDWTTHNDECKAYSERVEGFEPQFIDYMYIPEGKCQTRRHTEPHSIKYSGDLDCGAACDKYYLRCYGYSQGSNECRLWTQRDIIGGGENTGEWEGSSCYINHEKTHRDIKGPNYQLHSRGKCQDFRGEEPNHIISNRCNEMNNCDCEQHCNEMDKCYGYSKSYETGNPGCILWTQKWIIGSDGYTPYRWRETSCYIRPHDGYFNRESTRSGAFEAIEARMYNILASRNFALQFLAIIGVCSMIYHAAKVVNKRMLTTEIKRSYNSIKDVVQEEC